LQITFGSIFNIYHGTLILCCTTTDLGNFWYCCRDFWSCIYESPYHLLRRWYTVFARAILNFGILLLWLYRRVDRELARNFLVDPSRRQVGHPWCKGIVGSLLCTRG